MKIERSAGVVLFRDTPTEGRVYLLLDYGSHWDYPKGHVEAGEDDPTAARRELLEETGIRECELLDGFVHEIKYIFRARKGGLIQKTVIFFLGRTQTEQVVLSDEHVGSAWLSKEAAIKQLSYPNARAVLEKAAAHLKALADPLR